MPGSKSNPTARRRDPEWQREYHRRYRARHPDRMKEATRRWREAHQDQMDATAQAYRDRPETKAYLAAWHVANRERRQARRRELYAESPERFRMWARAYQTKKAGLEQGPIDPEAIVARDGNRCGVCGRNVLIKDRSFDHIIPVADGGSHTQANLQLTHLICNKRRGRGRIAAQLRLPI